MTESAKANMTDRIIVFYGLFTIRMEVSSAISVWIRDIKVLLNEGYHWKTVYLKPMMVWIKNRTAQKENDREPWSVSA